MYLDVKSKKKHSTGYTLKVLYEVQLGNCKYIRRRYFFIGQDWYSPIFALYSQLTEIFDNVLIQQGSLQFDMSTR